MDIGKDLQAAYDDAYGARIVWVEWCKMNESGKPCPYEEDDET